MSIFLEAQEGESRMRFSMTAAVFLSLFAFTADQVTSTCHWAVAARG
jgi:hypothetical protein